MRKYFKAFMLMLVVYGILFFGIIRSEYRNKLLEPVAPYEPYVAFGIETDSSSYIPFEEEGGADLK